VKIKTNVDGQLFWFSLTNYEWSQTNCTMQETTLEGTYLILLYKLHVGEFKEWEVKLM